MPRTTTIAALLTAALLTASAHAQVVLNEVYSNPPGSGTIDDRWEYIEIYGPAGMSLTGYFAASVFGGGDPDADNIPGPLPAGWDGGDEVGEIDEAWSLDGLTIGSNGLLVIYNNAQPSQARPFFNAGTNFATFQASHCPTSDVGGRIKNDGSATFVLVRKRPFHALNAQGVSLYDGVAANTITNGPLTYPSSIRYAWRKDVNPDVNFDGRIDFNGLGAVIATGQPNMVEIGINSERAATPAVGGPKSLEPYQMVDDVAWSNGGGKEYTRSQQQEISDTNAFNPDAVSRISYYGENPQRGHRLNAGIMESTRTADEEFVYGDVLDDGLAGLPLIRYNPAAVGAPTDVNGQKYNAAGQPDANGEYLLSDLNASAFTLTPGRFNDVDGTSNGGINITQFRFVRGDFNFDGQVNCDDDTLITAAVGASLDETETKTNSNGTALDASDDFTYTGWKHQGRGFNALLAMVRMDLTDGTTGEWNSGITVTAADAAAFHALFTCAPTCPGNLCGDQDFNGDGDFGTDQDIEAFFACLGGNCCTSCFCQGSDFNGDGDFGTDSDIEAFFRVLGGGNC